MSQFAVIMPAAGKSSRFKDKEKKPFATLDGRAVWLRSAELFVTRDDVCQSMIVIDKNDEEVFKRRFTANLAFMDIQIVHGGAERVESVANALAKLKPEVEFVAVHDAVRPCLTQQLIDKVFTKAKETGAALLAIPLNDTLKRIKGNHQVEETISRKGLWLAQTPQVFRRDWLEEAYAQRDKAADITDDAQLVEAAGHAVSVVEGSSTNIKITAKRDLALAEAVLKSQPKPKAGGPAHPFAEEEMWGGRL